jgi:hypothetical protein
MSYVSYREVHFWDNVLIITKLNVREKCEGMCCVLRCVEVSLEDTRRTNMDLERVRAAVVDVVFVPHSSARPTSRCGKVCL